MMVHSHSWLIMKVLDDSWQFLLIHAYSWRFIIIHDGSFTFLTVHDDSWLFMMVLDYSCTFLLILANSWIFLHILDSFFTQVALSILAKNHFVKNYHSRGIFFTTFEKILAKITPCTPLFSQNCQILCFNI